METFERCRATQGLTKEGPTDKEGGWKWRGRGCGRLTDKKKREEENAAKEGTRLRESCAAATQRRLGRTERNSLGLYRIKPSCGGRRRPTNRGKGLAGLLCEAGRRRPRKEHWSARRNRAQNGGFDSDPSRSFFRSLCSMTHAWPPHGGPHGGLLLVSCCVCLAHRWRSIARRATGRCPLPPSRTLANPRGHSNHHPHQSSAASARQRTGLSPSPRTPTTVARHAP